MYDHEPVSVDRVPVGHKAPSVRSWPDIQLSRSGVCLIIMLRIPLQPLARMWSPRGATGICRAWGLGLAKQGQEDVLEKELVFAGTSRCFSVYVVLISQDASLPYPPTD